MKKKEVILISLVISSLTLLSFKSDYFEIAKNLEIFTDLYKELNTYYVDETDPGKLIKSAMDEMLQTLDPYTNYIPESEIEDFQFMTTGQYGGIGAMITKELNMFISQNHMKDFLLKNQDSWLVIKY